MMKQILGLLLKKYSPFIAIVLSSMAFAVGHLRFNDIGCLFIWGFLLGFVYYQTNSIEVSILLHSFWNFSGLFIESKFIDIAAVLIIKYVILMAVSAIVIILILKYLNRYGVAKKINDAEAHSASLTAGKQ